MNGNLAAVDLVAICGIIIAIGGAIAILWKPIRAVLQAMRRIDELEKHSKQDHDAQQKRDELSAILARSHMAILLTSMEGNNTGKLRASYAELQNYLIDR